jgi:prolyl oligopeptidase
MGTIIFGSKKQTKRYVQRGRERSIGLSKNSHPRHFTSSFYIFALFASIVFLHSQPSIAQLLKYPAAKRDTLVSNYFGTDVSAPYQWMEDQSAPEVTAWVEAENKLTFAYLDKIPLRNTINERLTKLWNYERVGVPILSSRFGPLFYSKNSGLQNQSPVFMQKSIDAKASLILDPNNLSPDGSIAMADYSPSSDAHYLCYALSQGGSDWQELHIKDLKTGTDLADTVRWVKFSGISWTNDNQGFFYSRFPQPAKGTMLTSEAIGQQLYYHQLGTKQSDDKKFYDLKDFPGWYVGGGVTEDGRYLFINVNKGTDPKNKV